MRAKQKSMKVAVDVPKTDTSFAAHVEGYGYSPEQFTKDEKAVEARVQFAKAMVAAGKTIDQAARITVATNPLPPGFGHVKPAPSMRATASLSAAYRKLVDSGALSLEEAVEASERAFSVASYRARQEITTKPRNGQNGTATPPASGASAPAEREALPAHVPVDFNEDSGLVKPHPIEVYPFGHEREGCIVAHLKVPSVVLRVDGRYGVARPMREGEKDRRDDPDGRFGYYSAPGNSSCSTRLFHEEKTYLTRAQAERRAWALARELGRTEDWK